MDAQYPDDRFIREVLDEGERLIAGRTKQSFLLSLDKAKGVIVVVRGADGWHAAYECVPPKPLPPVRGMWAGAELPLSHDEVNQRWFRLAAGRIAEAVVLGQESERLGVAAEDMWRVIATLDGGVTVRLPDDNASYGAAGMLSFYNGADFELSVLARSFGRHPDPAILEIVWNVYQLGLSTGMQRGIEEGRRGLKRDLANFLSEAA